MGTDYIEMETLHSCFKDIVANYDGSPGKYELIRMFVEQMIWTCMRTGTPLPSDVSKWSNDKNG